MEMTPLLIVKVPVGKMTVEKAMNYMAKIRTNVIEATNHEYNLIVVPSRTEEFIFQSAFSPTDEVDKVLNNEEIKKMIKKYLEEKNGKNE